MTWEILVIYGLIECHLMAKHKAYHFTGSHNCASLNEELIYASLSIRPAGKKHKVQGYSLLCCRLVLTNGSILTNSS